MPIPPQTLCGVVVSSGKMMRAVKVRTAKQVYHKFLKKHFLTQQNHLVSDPTSSTRTGDVVRIAAEGQVSRHIKHVVTEIVAPWGLAVEERPPIPTEAERTELKRERKRKKLERKRLVQQDIREGSREARSTEQISEASQEESDIEDNRVEGVVEGTQVAS